MWLIESREHGPRHSIHLAQYGKKKIPFLSLLTLIRRVSWTLSSTGLQLHCSHSSTRISGVSALTSVFGVGCGKKQQQQGDSRLHGAAWPGQGQQSLPLLSLPVQKAAVGNPNQNLYGAPEHCWIND